MLEKNFQEFSEGAVQIGKKLSIIGDESKKWTMPPI
jgi:hypothetical protein